MSPRPPAGPRLAQLAPWWLSLTCAALLFGLALARYCSVHHHTFDLALYARMAWGIVHADGWTSVVNAPSLGVHISLVMLPLAALGAVFGQVPVLLLAQACAFAACVFPLWRLAERRLGARFAWLGAAAWLLYPNMAHVAAYEFHPSNLAVLPLCWAAEALDRRDATALWRWSLLALACREDVGLVVVLLGAALALCTRSRRGLGTAAAGALMLVVGASVVRAHAGSSEVSLDLHFGAWGGSPVGILPSLWREPERVLAHLLAPRTLGYLPMLLAPLLFLPLRAPWLLLPALAPLALNVISTFPTTTHFYSHYLTLAVPSLVSAGVVGLSRSPRLLRPVGYAGFVLALGIAHLFAGGSPLSLDFPRADFFDDERSLASRRVIAAIVPGESVQAPDPLLPHLAERRDVRRGPPPETGARWVVLDLSHRQRFAHTETLLRTSEEPSARRWLARPDHRVAVSAPPWLLLERRAFDARAPALRDYYRAKSSVQVGELAALCDCLTLERVTRTAQSLELWLRAEGACPEDLAVRLGPNQGPQRVDLLFDGVLSPAQLRAGDRLRSQHAFESAELTTLQRDGVWVGTLRSSGAPPAAGDPVSIQAKVHDARQAGAASP